MVLSFHFKKPYKMNIQFWFSIIGLADGDSYYASILIRQLKSSSHQKKIRIY